jgi:hypothetical protein
MPEDTRPAPPLKPSRAQIEDAIETLIAERGVGKTIGPSEVARHLGGQDEKVWRLLMKPIRAAAVDMTKQGRVAIRRKGKLADPDNFKGVYRIGLPGQR